MELGKWLLLCGTAAVLVSTGVEADEVELYKALITDSGYNSLIRPRVNHSDTVNVTANLELHHIRDVDEVNQVFQIVAFIITTWTDDYLTWNASDYNGLEKLVVPASVLWTPDIGIENSATSFHDSSYKADFYSVVHSDGTVLWAFGGEIDLLCSLDLTYYPLDTQSCYLELTNAAYTADMVDLNNGHDKVILGSELASDHGIWELLSTTATKDFVYHASDHTTPYPYVKWTINLDRMPTFYLLNFVMPSVLLLILAMSVFWLPCDSGEKVGLSVTVMLTFSVFQLTIIDITPSNSEYTPVLCEFFLFSVGVSCASTLSVVWVLFVHHRQVGKPPHFLRVIFFRYLARMMCMGQIVPNMKGPNSIDNMDDELIISDAQPEMKIQSPEIVEKEANVVSTCKFKAVTEKSELENIAADLRFIVEHLQEKVNSDSDNEEWKWMAQVLDRLLFWIFLFVAILFTLVFFIRALVHG